MRLAAVAGCFAFAMVAWFSSLLPDWAGWLAFALGIALYTRVGTPPARDPIRLVSPVSGRWRAVNSPTDRVPSHGVHAYGQTYALDLVHEPPDNNRPRLGWWPPMQRPEHFPGFGKHVRAPAEGVVVRAHDRERDHWSRNSYPALLYLLVESAIRELTGPGRVLGNYVVLTLDDGEYAAVAHLQRGSLAVRPGERVRVGEPIGRCGNSGNSTEPHVHLQCMDHKNVLLADGQPFTFVDAATGSDAGVPSSAAPFITP